VPSTKVMHMHLRLSDKGRCYIHRGFYWIPITREEMCRDFDLQ